MELKTIQKEIGQVWEQMKSTLDQQSEEIKKNGDAFGETKELVTKLEAKLDELELKAKAPAAGGVEGKNAGGENDKDKMHAKAFDVFLRNGYDGIKSQFTPEEIKSVMTATDNTTGGFFALPELIENEIIKNIVEWDPIRTVARIRNTSNRSIIIRRKSSNITGGYWTGEVSSRQDIGPFTFDQVEVPVHELTGYVDISRQDLDDSSYDLEAELNEEFSEQFGVTEGSSFIDGNGVNKPLGLLTTKSGFTLQETANGHATELQADGLIDAVYKVKPAYAQAGIWLLNRTTLRQIRKLKDGEDRYIWTPNLDIQKPPTILERPYVECVNMPDIAANAFPIIFGDIRKGYTIADRQGITIMRDEYTQANTATVRFYCYKRVGGHTVQPEAMTKIKMEV